MCMLSVYDIWMLNARFGPEFVSFYSPDWMLRWELYLILVWKVICLIKMCEHAEYVHKDIVNDNKWING